MEAWKLREDFHKNGKVYESALLRFIGVDGFDVYNCSVPFEFEGRTYMFGRVEKRENWADSVTVLFEKTGADEYTMVPGAFVYPLEDPYVTVIDGEFILGGTHVRKNKGELDLICSYFYRGRDPRYLSHFTCGPAGMKDIRLVQLPDSRIGVFTRPRSKAIAAEYGSEAIVGYAVLNTIDELDPTIMDKAQVIGALFEKDEWGGCNQALMLKDGRIGILGHRSYKEMRGDLEVQVYINCSFIFDPVSFTFSDMKIIGDKPSYPDTPAMLPYLVDCAFTTGIVPCADGKAELYSGIGDVAEGKLVIDNPFGDLLA